MNKLLIQLRRTQRNPHQTESKVDPRAIAQLQKVSTLFLDDHQIKPDDMESVGEFIRNMFPNGVELLVYRSHLGEFDLLLTMNNLA